MSEYTELLRQMPREEALHEARLRAQDRRGNFMSKKPFKFVATEDNVLLRPEDDADDKSKVGGLFLPPGVSPAKFKGENPGYMQLEVLAAGPNCKSAKPGMIALVTRAHIMYDPVEIDGERFTWLNERSLHALWYPDGATGS